jgi:hypothetical protein
VTQFNAPTYDVQKPTGRCAFSGRELKPGEPYMASLAELPMQPPPQETLAKPASAAAALGFQRVDVSLEAWRDGFRPGGLFCYWRSTVPQPNQKRRLFVDDQVLLNLFHRLEGATEEARLSFRFVLALILMRKKILKYEASEQRPDGAGGQQEWWIMSARTGDWQAQPCEVRNPRLDEAKIVQVTQQLGEILDGEV